MMALTFGSSGTETLQLSVGTNPWRPLQDGEPPTKTILFELRYLSGQDTMETQNRILSVEAGKPVFQTGAVSLEQVARAVVGVVQIDLETEEEERGESVTVDELAGAPAWIVQKLERKVRDMNRLTEELEGN